jgi:site-specific recombinase XerD
MALAFDRVPGCEHWTGTHVLRHTAATRLICRGANFKEIADLLGHRCLNTTAIYAKVDLPSLSGVALPWPEAQQ